jgi:lysophospholipase L1-like esterase
MSKEMHQYDHNMDINTIDENGIKWFNAANKPFEVSGLNWFESEKLYQRFPSDLDLPLTDAVSNLSLCSTGGQVRFRTNSIRLQLKVKLLHPRGRMDHMPSSGEGGLDLYIGEPGSERYISTARSEVNLNEFECLILEAPTSLMRSYTLNMPLYNGLLELSIGIDADAELIEPVARPVKPLVFYGTSIMQGGCASRPGMCFSTIVGRRLAREVLNYGFSGNGKGEKEVAAYLSRVKNPGLYFIDYQANVSPELMKATLPGFIAILRQAHPEVPIVIKSKIRYAKEYFYEVEGVETDIYANRIESRDFMKNLVKKQQASGDTNIYFMEGENIQGADYYECAVDGVHPTDLGFYRMAEAIAEFLKNII